MCAPGYDGCGFNSQVRIGPMCGLAGYFGPGVLPDDVLARMTRTLGHRGPDDERFYRAAPVALGFRRLSIIDVAGSPQPMSTPDGDLTCVFNGEIYNFAALRRSLAMRGHRFSTNGDTEVLLYAWREHGERMLEHLQGMFAFALWDRPARRLFIARDHLGVKPLYYHWDGTSLVFGSELKALVEHPGRAPRARPRRPGALSRVPVHPFAENGVPGRAQARARPRARGRGRQAFHPALLAA